MLAVRLAAQHGKPVAVRGGNRRCCSPQAGQVCVREGFRVQQTRVTGQGKVIGDQFGGEGREHRHTPCASEPRLNFTVCFLKNPGHVLFPDNASLFVGDVGET